MTLWRAVDEQIAMVLAVVTDRRGSVRAVDGLEADEVLRGPWPFGFLLGILALVFWSLPACLL